MGRSRVGPNSGIDPVDEDDEKPTTALEAREGMLSMLGLVEDYEQWDADMHQAKASKQVNERLSKADKARKKKDRKKEEKRNLNRFNAQLCCKLVYHSPDGEVHAQMLVEDSVYLNKLQPAVKERLGLPSGMKINLLYCDPAGETIPLTSQRDFSTFVDQGWCNVPWVIHVHDASKKGKEHIQLKDTAVALFDRNDVDNSGHMDKTELRRMLKALDLSNLQASEKLIDRFVDDEFNRIDTDESGTVSKAEFTEYVSGMTGWMRDQLMQDTNKKIIFATIASRAIEVRMPPTPLPEFTLQPDGKKYHILETSSLGVQLWVPRRALPEGSRVALSTLAPERVAYLSETELRRQGEFAFTSVVQIDVYEREEDTAPTPMRFDGDDPIKLFVPHAFSDIADEAGHLGEALESLVMLGAPHDSPKWEYLPKIDLDRLDDAPIKMTKDYICAHVPFSGIFCGFTNPDVEDIARVRFHIFALPEVSRDAPATIRVHLCAEVPDQLETMTLTDSSEWGVSKEVGVSEVYRVYQGAYFECTIQGQTRKLKWHGGRVQAVFTWTPPGADAAEKKTLDETLNIQIVEGEGRRGSRVAAVAKRMGLAGGVTAFTVPITLTPREPIRPNPPWGIEVVDRSMYDFQLCFRAPIATKGEKPPEISHYSLEISVPGPSGTYGPFVEFWQGQGELHPEYQPEKADKWSTEQWLKDIQDTEEREEMEAEAARAMAEALAKEAAEAAAAAGEEPPKAAPAEAEPEKPDPPFLYILEVAPQLVGRLRMRCWARGELRPSVYSPETKLLRWNGKVDKKSNIRLELERRRNAWRMELGLFERGETPTIETPKNKNDIEAYVPYDIVTPSLTDGLDKAVLRLRRLYREIGVPKGEEGVLFGMHINHVLWALSGKRVEATSAEPLLAVLELTYADIMLPMIDTVAVIRDEWAFVIEKLSGMVVQVVSHRDKYALLEDSIATVLMVLHELYETMRQCERDALLHAHCYYEKYTKKIKKQLKEELKLKVCDMLWSLATEMLKLQTLDRSTSAAANIDIPGNSVIMRLQVIGHLQDSSKKKKKFFGFGRTGSTKGS